MIADRIEFLMCTPAQSGSTDFVRVTKTFSLDSCHSASTLCLNENSLSLIEFLKKLASVSVFMDLILIRILSFLSGAPFKEDTYRCEWEKNVYCIALHAGTAVILSSDVPTCQETMSKDCDYFDLVHKIPSSNVFMYNSVLFESVALVFYAYSSFYGSALLLLHYLLCLWQHSSIWRRYRATSSKKIEMNKTLKALSSLDLLFGRCQRSLHSVSQMHSCILLGPPTVLPNWCLVSHTTGSACCYFSSYCSPC